MPKARKRAIVVAIWAVGMMPAALLMVSLGYADASFVGFVMAWATLLAIAGLYELIQTWFARRSARRPAPATQGGPEH
jgi:hypothetical protein